MTVNFLKPTKTNHITNKEYWREKLLEKIPPIWKRIIYGLSWLVIVLLGSLIGAKIFLSSHILWLKEIDVILFLFILVTVIIINRVSSLRGLKCQELFYYLLIIFLILNTTWSIGTVAYSDQNIYQFNIVLNFFVIIIGLLILPITRTKIVTPFVGIIIFLLLPGENIYPLLLITILLFIYFRIFFQKRRIEINKTVITKLFIGLLVLIFLINLLSFVPDNALVGVILSVYNSLKYQFYIIILTLGGMLFYKLSRDGKEINSYLESVELDIEKESKEEKIEKKGEKQFLKRFSFLDKIPITSFFIRWFYKEGWGYSILIVVIMVISFSFIYSPHLGNFMTVDEQRWIYTETHSELTPPVDHSEAKSKEFINASYQRSISYWRAYLSGDLASTFNNPNPSATVNFLHLPAYTIKNIVSFSTYLTVARLTIIIHNLLLILIIYYLFKNVFNKKRALLLIAALALYPLFIGFSRVINHDSIQGLYIVGFLLSLLGALKKEKAIFYKSTGIFLALALMTQFKTQFLVPLLFLYPVIHSYVIKKPEVVKRFVNKLGTIYLYAIATTIIILPAVLFYPQIIVNRFFFYTTKPLLLATLVALFIFTFALCFPKKIQLLYNKISAYEKLFIRLGIISIVTLIAYGILHLNYFFSTILNLNRIPSYSDAIIGTIVTFFFSTPTIILIFLAVALFYIFFKRPKLNFSSFLLFSFFVILVLGVLSTYTIHPEHGAGYFLISFKYFNVFIPILLISIFSSSIFQNLSKKTWNVILIILILSLSYGNYVYSPLFSHYQNIFTPKEQLISRTTYAFDTIATVPYINEHLPHNARIYNPRGLLENLVRPDIEIIEWHAKFWEHNPDYIVLEWEQTHQWTPVFNYYRENEQPLWSIEKNGVIITGIYKFNKKIDYESMVVDD